MSEAHEEAARRHFDRWSRTYERDRRSRWMGEIQRRALDALELTPTDALLDVGCGTGAAVRRASPEVARAVGIDLSSGMIEEAGRLAAGLTNVSFDIASAAHLPFDDGAFSALLCTSSFHHYPDPDAVVGEMARVLAPGGRIAIADPNRDRWEVRAADRFLRRFEKSHVRIHAAGELGALLSRHGFTDLGVRRTLRGTFLVVRGRRAA